MGFEQSRQRRAGRQPTAAIYERVLNRVPRFAGSFQNCARVIQWPRPGAKVVLDCPAQDLRHGEVRKQLGVALLAPCEEEFGERLRYYDLQRHWTKRIEPHLTDERLNAILVRDFNKFTFGNWKKKFQPGDLPRDFESCDWCWEHRGRAPRYWRYVKHSACHWLVNFNLRLAQLVEPNRPWCIVTSEAHSTVWDGKETLFEFNFLAFGLSADECFSMANVDHLKPGQQYRAGHPVPWERAA